MQAVFAISPFSVQFYSILAHFTLRLLYVFILLFQICHQSLIRFCLTVKQKCYYGLMTDLGLQLAACKTVGKTNVFVKPNEQNRACSRYAMARKGRMKSNYFLLHHNVCFTFLRFLIGQVLHLFENFLCKSAAFCLLAQVEMVFFERTWIISLKALERNLHLVLLGENAQTMQG